MSTPTRQQRDFQRTQARQAVDRICDAWPVAIAEAAALGYSSGGGDGRNSQGDHAEPTLAYALRDDIAAEWLRNSRRFLAAVCAMRRKRIDVRFHVPDHRRVICEALDEIVDEWPHFTAKLLDQLVAYSGTAAKRWPPTPRKGQIVVVDGVEIKVGDRSISGDVCAKCDELISGTALDPVRRFDGKPYHVRCFNAVRRQAQRVARRNRVAPDADLR
jgi:hypothetical protein